MSNIRKRIAGAAAGGLLVSVSAMLLAVPAGADTQNTTVNVTVAAGALTISSHPTSANLTGAQFNQTLPSTATGSFGTIAVTDGRGLPVPWQLTAASTNYTGSEGTITLGTGGAALTFNNATPNVTGTATVSLAAGGALTAANTPVMIATGTNGATLGDVVYSWNPTVDFVVPANTTAGTYSGTVTLTVA